MTLLEKAQHLQALAAGPQILEAIETYYADDVEIVEATGETATGKETQKQRVETWLSMVESIAPGGGVQAIAAHETGPGSGVVFVETADTITFKEGGDVRMEEVAVQRWEGGKVVHERFYYTPPPGSESMS